MPIKLGSGFSQEQEARIEIIPLIDIMFFLLAAFMLVSLSMVNLRSVKVDLPTAAAATVEAEKSLVSVSIDEGGLIYLEKRPVGENELALTMAARQKTNRNLRVFISADRDARHGDVIRALDLIRSAGIQNVAFEIRRQSPGPSSP
jgi:biopolymer transport protein ExbD